MTDYMVLAAKALQKRRANGGVHLHHRDCIHNLPTEEQLDLHGWTAERWQKVIGELPKQITPAEWQTEPLTDEHT